MNCPNHASPAECQAAAATVARHGDPDELVFRQMAMPCPIVRLKAQIVMMRRHYRPDIYQQFWQYLQKDLETISAHIDAEQIISILEIIADYSNDPIRSHAVLAICPLICENLVRYAGTVAGSCRRESNLGASSDCDIAGRDAMKALVDEPPSDAYHNLLRRLGRCLVGDRMIFALYRAASSRFATDGTGQTSPAVAPPALTLQDLRFLESTISGNYLWNPIRSDSSIWFETGPVAGATEPYDVIFLRDIHVVRDLIPRLKQRGLLFVQTDLPRSWCHDFFKWHNLRIICDSSSTAAIRRYGRDIGVYIGTHWRQPPAARWAGGLARSLLVYTDKGHGDTIRMYRYIPLLRRLIPKVIFESPRDLADLLCVTSDDYVKGQKIPVCERAIEIMELEHLIAAPMTVPYIRRLDVDQQIAALMEPDKFRIGFCWRSCRTDIQSDNRSCPSQYFVRLLRPDWQLISLQRDEAHEIHTAISHCQHSRLLRNFSTISMAMQFLDVVVSVDTSIAHLAGAMGLQTYVILPHGRQFPVSWYPTMTAIWQTSPGDWGSVFDQLLDHLTCRIWR